MVINIIDIPYYNAIYLQSAVKILSFLINKNSFTT